MKMFNERMHFSHCEVVVLGKKYSKQRIYFPDTIHFSKIIYLFEEC